MAISAASSVFPFPPPLRGRARVGGSRIGTARVDPLPQPLPARGRGAHSAVLASPLNGSRMTHPGEQFYPEGVRWEDPIARGTLPDLLSKAAADYGERPAIEFRDHPISYAELEAMVEVAAASFLRAGYGKNHSVAPFLGNTPD